MREWMRLKQIPRTGWVRSGIKAPESVAAHSWGMAVLAMELCPPELDKTFSRSWKLRYTVFCSVLLVLIFLHVASHSSLPLFRRVVACDDDG